MSIKKTIITTATIVLSVAMVASVVGAQTPTVAQLMAEIASLQAQLTSLSGTTTPATTGACAGVTFTRNLTVGATGSDVKCLQTILNRSASTQVSATGAGSPGYETTTFGPKTLVAVKIYQAANGLTPANQVGPMTRVKLNAALGSNPTNPSPTNPSNPTGPVSAALSFDNPASGALVGSQATADLLHLNFTGTGTVTSVTLQRTGISDQNTLTNVYLFDGNTRLTDGYSFNVNGQMVINGLSIAVNGSKVISVKADVVANAYQTASTISVSMTGYTANGSAVSSNVQGNMFMLVTGTAATAYLSANTYAGLTPSVNAGTTQYTFWSSSVQVNTRALLLKGASFRMIGSAPTDALSNVKMFVDGVDTGRVAMVTATNGSNYETFDLSSSPISLPTGSHTVDIRADVQKGSFRTLELTLQQASDLTLADTQLGVNIAIAGPAGVAFVANAGANVTIAAGSVTVNVDPTFTSQTTVSSGSTNAVIGRFVFHAYGEDVKVNTLQVNPFVVSGVASGCTITNGTSTMTSATGTCGLNNVTLYFNGSQIGTQKNFTQTINTATEGSSTVAGDLGVFTLGSQMVLSAGVDSTLEVRADLQTNANTAYTAGTVKVVLPFLSTGTTVNYLNAQGQSSQNSASVPSSAQTTTGLTISSATLAVSANSAYANQTIAPNTTSAKIGSYIIQNQSTAEAVRLTALRVVTAIGTNATTAASDLAANTAYIGGITDMGALRTSDTTGSGATPIQPTGDDTFSVNDVLQPGASIVVDVYANIGSTATMYIKTGLEVTSIGAIDNIAVKTPLAAATPNTTPGQLISMGTGSIGLPSVIVSSTTPAEYIAAGNPMPGTTQAQATFNFTSTSGDSTIQELKFTVSGSDASSSAAVTSICVGTVCAQPVLGIADLTGLNLNVTQSGGLQQNVGIAYARIGANGILPGNGVQVGLSYVKYISGGTTTTSCPTAFDSTCTNSTLAATIYTPSSTGMNVLVGSAPTVTVPATTVSGLGLTTENQIGQVTVAANSQGSIRIRAIRFNIAHTGFTTWAFTPANGTSTRLAIGNTTVAGSYCAVDDYSNPTYDVCTFTTNGAAPSGSNVGYASDFIIGGGNSSSFNLFATLNTTNTSTTTSAQITTSVPAATFYWDDSSNNGATGPTRDTNLSGSLIYNFPTTSYVIHQ